MNSTNSMKKLTAEKCREQFEEWWESFYEIKPMEPWSSLYSPEHDYYVDEAIDGQYDAWKASRKALEIALPVLEQQERGEASIAEESIGVWNPLTKEIAVDHNSGIKVVDVAHWHCHCTMEVIAREMPVHPMIKAKKEQGAHD